MARSSNVTVIINECHRRESSGSNITEGGKQKKETTCKLLREAIHSKLKQKEQSELLK